MKEIRSGLFLPTSWKSFGSRDIAQAMTEVAGAAESLGIDSIWACDHIVAPEKNAGSARCIEPLILMASLAQLFPRLVVGTDVLVLPQRNAILVAKQAATLSVLTGDRFILGAGVGWNEVEFGMVNADFKRRGAHADEAVRLMKALWRETPISFDGEFYHLEDAYFYPDPPGDGPPVWVGGFSRPALARAMRLGDGWMPFWGQWDGFVRDLDTFRKWVRELRDTERGHSIRVAANIPLRVATSSGENPSLPAYPVEEIITMVRAYRDAGLQTFIWLIHADDLDDYFQQMRLLVDQIMPAITDESL